MDIGLICGGRGASSIIKHLTLEDTHSTTLLVNAFDDGLSTGSLRSIIKGMLGPSDFRKNLSYTFDDLSDKHNALITFLEYRLTNNELRHLIDWSQRDECEFTPCTIKLLANYTDRSFSAIVSYIKLFLSKHADCLASLDDCSLGNLLFAHLYLINNNDFNLAVDHLNKLVSTSFNIYNVCSGSSSTLMGVDSDGCLLLSESAIVNLEGDAYCKDFVIIPSHLVPSMISKSIPFDFNYIQGFQLIPQANQYASSSVRDVDVLIICPGSLSSSVLPSLRILRRSIISRIHKNSLVFILLNLDYDNDITGLSLYDILLMYEKEIPLIFEQESIYILADNSSPFAKLCSSCLNRWPQLNSHFLVGNFKSFNNPSRHNGAAVMNLVQEIYTSKMRSSCKLYAFIDMSLLKQPERYIIHLEESLQLLEMDYNVQVKVKARNSLYTFFTYHSCPSERKQRICGENNSDSNFDREILDRALDSNNSYFLSLRGPGIYNLTCLSSILNSLILSNCSVVYGSRLDSRKEATLMRKIYGENILYLIAARFSALALGVFCWLRYGQYVRDAMTGFRIYKLSSYNREFISSILLSSGPIMDVNPGELPVEFPVPYKYLQGFSLRRHRISQFITYARSILFSPHG
jgi:2-phospho-L-lactate transferase/gluconeogenesis factor (CofD/UPF0052 family)